MRFRALKPAAAALVCAATVSATAPAAMAAPAPSSAAAVSEDGTIGFKVSRAEYAGLSDRINSTLPDGMQWVQDPQPRWEWNWGWVTGKLYLDRGETRTWRDTSNIIAFASAPCLSVAWTGVGAAICAGIATNAYVLSLGAARYYENGNCLKVKVAVPALIPEEHRRGERNCR